MKQRIRHLKAFSKYLGLISLGHSKGRPRHLRHVRVHLVVQLEDGVALDAAPAHTAVVLSFEDTISAVQEAMAYTDPA